MVKALQNLPRLAICAVVRDEAPYLDEWVTFHRRQGVSIWCVYDNGSRDGTVEALRRLDIAPIMLTERPHDFAGQQCTAYLTGDQMLANKADWVAYIDTDEFLFGREGRTLQEVLATVPPDVGAVAIQQVVFGSSGHLQRSPEPVTTRFVHCAPRTHPECLWFKTVARPECVARHDSAHSVVLRNGRYTMVDGSPLTRAGNHPGVATRRVEGPIGLHHYILKSREEFLQKSAKWSDRLSGISKREAYFSDREKYANSDECRELVGQLSPAPGPTAGPAFSGEAETRRVAAVTMVYDEPDFLPIWLDYYGSQVGIENCFVLDHGSDDGSTDNLRGANRIRIPRSQFDEFKRAASVSALTESLLSWYDFVAYTDVDEILVPDPALAGSIPEYCAKTREPVITAIGLNLIHRFGHEIPLDPAKPILPQRTVALPTGAMCKPSLISKPVTWAIGFHSYNGPVTFDSLYLFHLAYADYSRAMARQEKRRRAVADHPYQYHPHKLSNNSIRSWIEGWSKIPVEPTATSDEMLADFCNRVMASQNGREKERFRIDLDIKGRNLWRIPERFKKAF